MGETAGNLWHHTLQVSYTHTWPLFVRAVRAIRNQGPRTPGLRVITCIRLHEQVRRREGFRGRASNEIKRGRPTAMPHRTDRPLQFLTKSVRSWIVEVEVILMLPRSCLAIFLEVYTVHTWQSCGGGSRPAQGSIVSTICLSAQTL